MEGPPSASGPKLETGYFRFLAASTKGLYFFMAS
jgi:hypothetical protein